MTELHQIYKCALCGDMIEIILAGKGDLICCGQPMQLLKENTTDASLEKHVPLIVKTETGFKVIIGSVPHPMEQSHYIQWIELIADGKSYKEFLKPGMKPEAEFCVKASKVMAREHCNLHGLWKAEK